MLRGVRNNELLLLLHVVIIGGSAAVRGSLGPVIRWLD